MTPEPLALPTQSTTHPWLSSLTLAVSADQTGTDRRSAPPGAEEPSAPRPFDAADDYLLYEFERRAVEAGADVLVVNDRYGALAAALAGRYRVTTWGDSYVAFTATEANLARNGLDTDSVSFVPSTSGVPSPDAAGVFAAVLVRVPKSLALLEHQLHGIRSALPGGVPVLCGGMEKHLSRRVNTLLDTLIGPPTASLGWRKARLIMAYGSPDVVGERRESPFPTTYTVTEVKPPLPLSNQAGVFSQNGLDLGTRTMLPFLEHDLGEGSDPDVPLQVADLGCGNGVIGILSARMNPQADYSFFDESFLAVESAEKNWNAAFPGRSATFVCGHAMADAPPRTFDVIFCNPPFHQDHSIGDETAWRMFLSAHRSLAAGGSFLVVGNRHLNYHHKLRRLFGKVDQLGGSPKFVVLHAERS